MYGGGKGIADSALPYKRTPPSWLKVSSGEVEDHGTCISRRRPLGVGEFYTPLQHECLRPHPVPSSLPGRPLLRLDVVVSLLEWLLGLFVAPVVSDGIIFSLWIDPQSDLPSLPTAASHPHHHPTTTAVCKLAKNGMTPSQIGVILRDSHGIAQVKTVTGQKILRLLKRNGACCLIDD